MHVDDLITCQENCPREGVNVVEQRRMDSRGRRVTDFILRYKCREHTSKYDRLIVGPGPLPLR